MYETHITIEPVLDDRRKMDLQLIAEQCHFKVAELLMVKKDGKMSESRLDSFLTGHDKEYPKAYDNMTDLISRLQQANFKVWRYKIECIILDSKYQHDPEGLL